MAEFVHEHEKFFNSNIQLKNKQFEEFKRLLALRDECWNSKAKEITHRSRKKLAFDRASTAHQNGEKDVKELYQAYYNLEAGQKTRETATKVDQKTFTQEYQQLDKWTKKSFRQFIQKVDEFTQKTQELYPFQRPELSDDEEDQQFEKAFTEFEAMDEL